MQFSLDPKQRSRKKNEKKRKRSYFFDELQFRLRLRPQKKKTAFNQQEPITLPSLFATLNHHRPVSIKRALVFHDGIYHKL